MNTKNKRISVHALFWALLFIAIAICLLLDGLGVTRQWLPKGLSVWRILLGAIFAWWLVWGVIKLAPFAICFPLAGEVMLFDRFILAAAGYDWLDEVASVWLMLLIALLLSIGFEILKHAFSRSEKQGVSFTFSGGNAAHIHKATALGGKVTGNSTQYFDCTAPFHGSVENNLGSTLIYFSNTELYQGGSTLRLENNLGSIVLHAPEDWLVVASIDNSLGATNVAPSTHANPEKKLTLHGENNLGSISVKYVPVEVMAEDGVREE